ncbi:MAG: hypothetical protein LBE13_22510, partial [Bacteroidales bacterium]|nr:hypothetical protein [Bacteroidales bacterium]
ATNFHLNIKKIEYVNKAGQVQSVVTNPSKVNVIRASTDGTSVRSLAIDGFNIIDPHDIVFNGVDFTLDFNLTSDYSPGNIGNLNLNPVIKVPAYFTLYDLERRDTTSVNLAEVAKIFNDTSVLSLRNVTFYLNITNALPMGGRVQVYFADENYHIIDSIQSDEISLEYGIPDASTFLIKTPMVTTTEIKISEEKFNEIKDAKYLIFKEFYSSYPDPVTKKASDVKLFKSNYIKILLSCKIDTHLEGNPSNISY